MQSGYGIQQQHNFMEESMSTNSTEFNPHQQYHILQQIHALSATQQCQNQFQAYFQHEYNDLHHHQIRLNESYYEPGQENIIGYSDSVPPFPESLKLVPNDESGRNTNKDALLRGSETPNCWQNQQDSANQQNSCWRKPLTAPLSYEESEIEDKHDHQEINRSIQEPEMINCLERESILYQYHYGELEEIYKHNQTGSGSLHLPASEASVGEEKSMRTAKKRRKRKKVKDQLDSMVNFLESLVKQIMENQENLHRRFTQVIKKLDQERREREEAWRKQELAKFEKEAAARAREKAMATSREAAIVSYLEKITGQRINLPPLKLQPVISKNPFCTKLNSTSATDARGDEHMA